MDATHIALTPEQKSLLVSLSQETGKSPTALLEEALEGLQEYLRFSHVRVEPHSSDSEKTKPLPAQVSTKPEKPIWEKFIEAGQEIPDAELDHLPTDLAAQVDHYLYGTPKR